MFKLNLIFKSLSSTQNKGMIHTNPTTMEVSSMQRSPSRVAPKYEHKSTRANRYHSELLNLKIDLKKWEYHFISENKRSPKKEDIQKLPHVRKMYKDYNAFKKLSQNQVKISERKDQLNAMDKKLETPLKTKHQTNDNINLGPTPQIHGTVQSILDVFISPSDTTPLNKVTDPNNTNQENNVQEIKKKLVFDTIQDEDDQADNIADDDDDDDDDLPFGDVSMSPPKSAGKEQPSIRRIHSPIRLLENITINLRKTPLLKKDQEPYSLESPSPLIKIMNQWNRAQGTPHKSLYELGQERDTIIKEFEAEGISINLAKQLESEQVLDYESTENEHDDDDDGTDTEQTENPSTKDGLSKKDTQPVKKQKRRKRHIKVMAKDIKKNDFMASKILKKNLHEELRKIKQKSVNEFYGIPSNLEDTVASEDEYEDPDAATKKPKKKKYNLVSENFVRMKIQKRKNRNFRRFKR